MAQLCCSSAMKAMSWKDLKQSVAWKMAGYLDGGHIVAVSVFGETQPRHSIEWGGSIMWYKTRKNSWRADFGHHPYHPYLSIIFLIFFLFCFVYFFFFSRFSALDWLICHESFFWDIWTVHWMMWSMPFHSLFWISNWNPNRESLSWSWKTRRRSPIWIQNSWKYDAVFLSSRI